MIEASKNSHQKNYFENLLNKELIWLSYLQEKNKLKKTDVQLNENSSVEQKVFTVEELSKYDGAEGRPAYVAVNGIVYDVSLAPGWGGGTHFSLYAGQDLTDQFNRCHDGVIEILSVLPRIGIIFRGE